MSGVPDKYNDVDVFYSPQSSSSPHPFLHVKRIVHAGEPICLKVGVAVRWWGLARLRPQSSHPPYQLLGLTV